jgi:hypothetical protein
MVVSGPILVIVFYIKMFLYLPHGPCRSISEKVTLQIYPEIIAAVCLLIVYILVLIGLAVLNK